MTNRQRKRSGIEPAMEVTVIHLKNAYGNIVHSKGYLVENPPHRNGDGTSNLTWTIHSLGGLGVVFWLESEGRIIVRDVLLTSEHVTSMMANGIQIPTLEEAKEEIAQQKAIQEQTSESLRHANAT